MIFNNKEALSIVHAFRKQKEERLQKNREGRMRVQPSMQKEKVVTRDEKIYKLNKIIHNVLLKTNWEVDATGKPRMSNVFVNEKERDMFKDMKLSEFSDEKINTLWAHFVGMFESQKNKI